MRRRRLRDAVVVVAVACWFLWLVPPFALWARRYEYVQTLQFCSFAFVVPALFVNGAAWRRLGLVGRYRAAECAAPTVGASGVTPSAIGSSHGRAVLTTGLFLAVAVLWRTAPAVDALVNDPWITLVESLSLVVTGSALFCHLIESPPLRPGTSRPYRIGISAVVMWTIWIVAYLNGMSRTSWYGVFRSTAHRAVSLAADQQLAAGAMWMVSAAVFLPIVFWNLVQWLQSEDDPDDELYRLVRQEKSRGFFGSGE